MYIYILVYLVSPESSEPSLLLIPPIVALFAHPRAVLQSQTEAAHPQGLGHVCNSQRTVLLLHVQLRRRAGGGLQAASGEQTAQSQSVGAEVPP